MNKTLKNVGLGLLATLATVGGGAAEAGYKVQGVHLMDGGDFGVQNKVLATDMIRSLTEMGIPVVDGGKQGFDTCKPQEDRYTLGFYVPSKNIMVICTNVAGKDMQFETLTHEVVHVIQDARAGIENGELNGPSRSYFKALVNHLSDDKANTITSLYDREDWGVETEAFYFEDKPGEVAQELRRWAF